MANSFTSVENVFWEEVVEGFDPNNMTAKRTKKYGPMMKDLERSGGTFRRKVNQIARTSAGLSVASDYQDLLNLTVPVSLTDSHIINHAFTLTATERNDPDQLKDAAKAAVQALSAKIDVAITEKIATYGTLVATETGNFQDYDKLAKGETMLLEREVGPMAVRHLGLNPRMAQKMANDLAGRATDNKRDMGAYERSLLPDVAGFDTYKTNVLTAITGVASPTVVLNGANQRKTPTVFDGTNSTAADNRFQTITVTNTSGSMANGDAFTIAGVYAVGMITKKSTGQLQTFRVISGGGTTSLVISPAIIPVDFSGDAFASYGNVTTTPANGAALTRLNTVTTQPSIFWCEGAVELVRGKLDVDDGNFKVQRAMTDSGIEIVFVKESEIDDLSVKYRLSTWVNPEVLVPDMCGIYLPGQTAAFG